MEERRQDDKILAVFIQKFNDFVENTEKYRRNREEIEEHNMNRVQTKIDLIFVKLAEMKTVCDKLPCESRKVLWDTKMDGIEKDSARQWRIIGVIWGAIGSACLAIFIAWLNIKK